MDLLAIDAEGYLYAIELKRDRTPRDVVAQVLDYGSWITDLGHEEIGELFSTHHKGARLEEVFEDRFGGTLPEALNAAHHLVIVASVLDNSTERIVRYLTEQFSVPVSVLFFRYYLDGDREYLARTWLNAPSEADATAAKPGKAGKAAKEPWNGQDFYVAVGEDEHRTWADQLMYGYISAGGGKKYTSPLGQLFPGARVFAYIPQVGYGVRRPCSMDQDAAQGWRDPREGAVRQSDSACKLRNAFTLERLTERFGLVT